ncbi:MAG TPA: hypothetical protein VNK67_05305 [Burkholderiales bacterium]|nr:hypothetical protein [Burkholderiales bacterium]
MGRPAYALLAASLIPLALAGCAVRLHGLQTSGGASATSTSAQVSGSVKFSGGRLSFSSGQVPPPSAPGGHVSLGKGASAALVLGLVLADAVTWLDARLRGQPAAPQAEQGGDSIAESCSCYRRSSEGAR